MISDEAVSSDGAVNESDPVGEVAALLERMGLTSPGEDVRLDELSGGVSSDIWLVHRAGESFVLKRAREKLKVAADWHAPVNRGASEAAWLNFAADVIPGCAPRVLAIDDETFAMALEYFDPGSHRNWKSELMAGRASSDDARAVGRALGKIQSHSTRVAGMAARFDNQELFESLRIEPYLRRTAAALPGVRGVIEGIIEGLEHTRLALVHGDLSPKNVLIGGEEAAPSAVILDAECATWGDPVFDAAFCLSHLALKELHFAKDAASYRAAARAFELAYLSEVTWEDAASAGQRINLIVSALLLARVVGASPVEYLDDVEQERVVALATRALKTGRAIWDIVDEGIVDEESGIE